MDETPLNGCTVIDELLLDGSPEAMEQAAAHARGCPACDESLAAWNDIGATARSMRTDWPSDLLWPRIERALQKERRRPAVQLRHFAAAALLTIALGATAFHAIRVQTRTAAFDHHILRVAALDEVEEAEKAYVNAIRKLERIAEPKLEDCESPLMVSYREKLMLLDDAIAECEATIARNRQNAHLRSQLLAMYSEKQQTLQDVLREENHADIR